MKRVVLGFTLVGGLLGCGSSNETAAKATPSAKATWSYEGSNGPERWGDLSPDWSMAKVGKRQSPVDIVTSQAIRKDGPTLKVSYQDTSLEVFNNGHTVEDDYHGGGTLTIDGQPYKLAQFHFHSPSEHTTDGKHAPMELHLVHKDARGKLAVIGVMIQEGRAHPQLALLSQHLPAKPGRKEAVAGVAVNASKLLPPSLASYRYSGSLTTPPCSEEVAWFVLQEPIQASAEQIAAFRNVLHRNNRPTQPLNGREVIASN